MSFRSCFLGVYAQQWDFWVIWQFYCLDRKQATSSLCSKILSLSRIHSSLSGLWRAIGYRAPTYFILFLSFLFFFSPVKRIPKLSLRKTLSHFFSGISVLQASLVAQLVKNLPAMWKAWVWFLGWEDPLEKSMATHSSILAWRIPMHRGAWQAAVHGVKKSRMWLRD